MIVSSLKAKFLVFGFDRTEGIQMPVLKPIKGNLYLKWLHSGLYKDVANLEFHSNESFLTAQDVKSLMCSRGVGGFVISELNKTVAYVVFEKQGFCLDILSLVVHQDYRRKGIATILLQKLETRKGINKICICVRESNLDAHLFLKKSGFLAKKISRKYFIDQFVEKSKIEDGYFFEKSV